MEAIMESNKNEDGCYCNCPMYVKGVCVVNIKDGEKRNVWCQQVKYGHTWICCEFGGKCKLPPC